MMRFAIFAIVLFLIAGSVLFPPSLVSAHGSIWPTGYWGNPLLSCSGSGGAKGDASGLPLCRGLCDLAHTLEHFIYFGMSLAIFAFAPVLLVWGGLMIVLGGASPGRIETGKKILWGTIIGIALVLLSFQILDWLLLAVTGNSLNSQVSCSLPSVVPADVFDIK